jgi:hypothetical protein
MRAPPFALATLAVVSTLVVGCSTDLGHRDGDAGASIDAFTPSVDAGHGTDAWTAPGTDAWTAPGDDAWTPPPDDAWTPPPVDAWMPPCPGADGTELDLHLATIVGNPPDLADWPATTRLTEVDFTNDGVHVECDKLDGASRWPDVVPPGWDGPLQYTMGLVECIGGQWYASAVIEFWYGLSASGGNVAMDDQIAMNWYYDAIRWGALAGRQPATGEIVGVFIAAGNLRNITTDDTAQSPVMERSNVVLVPFPDVSGATHSF